MLIGSGGPSAVERSRLVEIVEAAKAEDWERFACLTDRPFANTTAMAEQFRDASGMLRRVRDEPTLEAIVKYHDDGSRLIFAKLVFNDPVDLPIILTLHSTSAAPESTISIWTFYQDVHFG